MTRAVTLFSIGFWSVASVLILMEITADRAAMPSARAAGLRPQPPAAFSQSSITIAGDPR